MALWAKVTLIGLGVMVVALAFAVWLGSRLQQRALAQLVASLVRRSGPASEATRTRKTSPPNYRCRGTVRGMCSEKGNRPSGWLVSGSAVR